MGCLLQLGPDWTWLLVWAILLPFYFCHWEEYEPHHDADTQANLHILSPGRYYTGILEMGKFNGPVEAQLLAMTTCYATAVAGNSLLVSDHPILTCMQHIMIASFGRENSILVSAAGTGS